MEWVEDEIKGCAAGKAQGASTAPGSDVPERHDATSAIFQPREQSIGQSRRAFILSRGVRDQSEACVREAPLQPLAS